MPCLVVAILSLVFSKLAGAQDYQWTEMVIPGTTVESVWGLNDNGQVALFTTDGASGIYENGTFTPLPPLEGFQVGGIGINNDGVITGNANDVAGIQRGFILRGSTYTLFSRPGWDNTEPRAIANSGLITGYSFAMGGIPATGFIYDPDTDTFTDATPPGSTFTITQGMNRFGRITGNGIESGIGRYGFVWQQGTISEGQRELLPFLVRLKIDVGTNARGINDSGVVVGFIAKADGRSDGFVGSDARGYQRLVAPGGEMPGNSTVCEGINNFAQVSCEVMDSKGNTVGAFIGSPGESKSSVDLKSHADRVEGTHKPSEELVIPTTQHRRPLP
jgi:hypothetical protein